MKIIDPKCSIALSDTYLKLWNASSCTFSISFDLFRQKNLFIQTVPLERGNRSSKQFCEISNDCVCDYFCFSRGGFLIFSSEKTFQRACQNSGFFSCLSPRTPLLLSSVHMFRWGYFQHDATAVLPHLLWTAVCWGCQLQIIHLNSLFISATGLKRAP